ncbi:hypothetical protein [Microbacterium sp. YY-01]|uniref:hypothetical protein n=1 Tax=Microbacterium sp. YY-01 TaxID=3421634 RepID=UPI003D17DA49
MITAYEIADVEQKQWTQQLEFHLDLIPKLLGAMLDLAAPDVRATQLDQPRVTGGGYRATVPVTDEGAGADATYLWSLFADYTLAVAEWLGVDAVVPDRCPDTSQAAFGAALVVVDTLIRHAHLIYVHRELEGFEREMCREIRRLQRRYLPAHEGVQQHARTCVLCGAVKAVRVVWADGVGGSPRPRMVAVCRVCGKEYTEQERSDPRERSEYVAASKAERAMAEWRPSTNHENGSE